MISRRGLPQVLAVVTLFLFPWPVSLAAADAINPPFGLEWGQPAGAVEDILDNSQARKIDSSTEDGVETWTVDNLPQSGLRRALLRFRKGYLIGVELQYQAAEWNSRKYQMFLSQARRKIEAKLGDGQLIARSQSPVDDGVTQTVIGYEWVQPGSTLQLFYFSATQGSNAFHTVSLHYKAM